MRDLEPYHSRPTTHASHAQQQVSIRPHWTLLVLVALAAVIVFILGGSLHGGHGRRDH